MTPRHRGPNAHIDESATVDPTAWIGANVYIGPRVVVGPGCVIKPGAVIGSDGFGYDRDESGRWIHRSHSGGVVLDADVHVGANTCIDQGTRKPTRVRAGTRIDNLVHVAHNVDIGRDVVVVAGAEISGSVVVEDGAWIGPKACVHQHRTIGARALIGMGAVVLKDVPPDVTVAGSPARVINDRVGVRDKM